MLCALLIYNVAERDSITIQEFIERYREYNNAQEDKRFNTYDRLYNSENLIDITSDGANNFISQEERKKKGIDNLHHVAGQVTEFVYNFFHNIHIALVLKATSELGRHLASPYSAINIRHWQLMASPYALLQCAGVSLVFSSLNLIIEKCFGSESVFTKIQPSYWALIFLVCKSINECTFKQRLCSIVTSGFIGVGANVSWTAGVITLGTFLAPVLIGKHIISNYLNKTEKSMVLESCPI